MAGRKPGHFEDVTHHVLWADAFGGALIVAASRGVDVMVAGVPAARGRIDPSLQLHVERRRASSVLQLDAALLADVLRAAPAGHCVTAGRKPQRLAIGAIHLLLEEEVRRQPFGSRGINSSARVLYEQ